MGIESCIILLHLWCLELRPPYFQLATPRVRTALFLPLPPGAQDLAGELPGELAGEPAGELDLARRELSGESWIWLVSWIWLGRTLRRALRRALIRAGPELDT
jgi:hypothetical protein